MHAKSGGLTFLGAGLHLLLEMYQLEQRKIALSEIQPENSLPSGKDITKVHTPL
jgi:hypothetical protein